MPKKYHISIKETPPRFHPVGKYATVEFREDCAGSCHDCVKDKCIYGIFEQNYLHISSMKDPQYLYTCKGCFRCVQECTRGIFSRVTNPDYETLGSSYWNPDIIHQTWVQAQTGRVPVSGAGYGGPFTGNGFDSMWTDMSEIVRPTRDGIHGREYINTSIELSRKPHRLEFANMKLVSRTTPILEIQLPILFQQPQFGILSRNVLLTMAMAATELDTMMFIQPQDYSEDLTLYIKNLIPCLHSDNYVDYEELIKSCRMAEISYEEGVKETIGAVKDANPDIFISVGLELDDKATLRALEMAQMEEVDMLHFYADADGNEVNTENPRFLKEMIREVHMALVDASIRLKPSLIFSGGIALAEHLAKAVICGADGVTIDNPLLLALECRMCYQCKQGKPCPVKLGEIRLKWGRQRIVNLIGALRNQLIEVMGAMGIREARRLRGEVGRSMWFEDLERENFAPIFGERRVKGPA